MRFVMNLPVNLTHRGYQIIITSGIISAGLMQVMVPHLQNTCVVFGVIVNLIWVWENTEKAKGKL
jgi:hypothetical protein